MSTSTRCCFRVGTGAFALLVIVIVGAIGVELFRESRLSIHQFGWQFWQTDVVGSGRRRVRRAAVHLGHALLVDPRPADLDPDRAGHRDLHFRAVAAVARKIARVSDRAARSGSVDRLRRLGHLRAGAVRSRSSRRRHRPGSKTIPLFAGPPLGIGMMSAALILAVMVIPFTSSVAREVLKAVPTGAARGCLRARRHTMGSHSDGALLRADGNCRRGYARPRPRARRDDGRDDGDRQQPAESVGRSSRRSTRWRPSSRTSSPRQADDLHLHALIEIGLVLFIITLIINAISRMFIWSMGRQRRPRPRLVAAPAPEAV